MSRTDLIGVMPVYNEEANIGVVVAEWLRTFANEGIAGRLIAVNDGSTDETWSMLKKLQLQFPEQLISIDKPNSGHGTTCRYGYDAALQEGADWILQIDSDGQCDPAFFPLFWSKRQEADCIFGMRTQRDDGSIRKLVSAVCRVLTAIVTRRDLKDGNVPYRLIRQSALRQALRMVPRNFDLQNVALTLALKRMTALRWSYVPIRFRSRQGGTNSINLPRIAKMGIRMLSQINRVGSKSSEIPETAETRTAGVVLPG